MDDLDKGLDTINILCHKSVLRKELMNYYKAGIITIYHENYKQRALYDGSKYLRYSGSVRVWVQSLGLISGSGFLKMCDMHNL